MATQPHIVIDSAMLGINMCYAENCNSVATKVCDWRICCQQYGCNRRICSEHTSRKSWCKPKGAPNPSVCLNCEKHASKCQWALYCFCCAIFMLIILLGVIVEELELEGGFTYDQ